MTLYQLFIVGWLSPPPDDSARYEFLVKMGLAEISVVDGIAGYRLTESGLADAHRRWGRLGRSAR